MKNDSKDRLVEPTKPTQDDLPPALTIGASAVTAFFGLYGIYESLIEGFLLGIALGTLLVGGALILLVGLASEVLKIRIGFRTHLLVWATVLPTIILAIYIYVGQGSPSDDILTAMATVCQGRGVPQAGTFISGHSPHPIVLINESNETGMEANDWPAKLPHAWRPSQIGSTELVVCVRESQEEIFQTCPYEDGRSVIRYQYKRDVMLMEARTGKIIMNETLRGDPAHECYQVAGFEPAQMVISHHGTPVSLSQIVSLLKPFVESDR